MRTVRSLRASRRQPSVDEQHFIDRSRERVEALCAGDVVKMQVRDVEELFQSADHSEVLFLGNPVKLHNELVDSLESRRRRPKQRFPLSAFDIHFDHHAICTCAAGQLSLQGIKVASTFICQGRGTNALWMEQRDATLTDRLSHIKAIVLMYADVECAGDIASPPVVSRDAV